MAMTKNDYDSVHEGCYDIEEKLKQRVKRLEEALFVSLDFVEHWVGDHKMDCYRFVPRQIAADLKAALAKGDADAQAD